MNYVGGQYITGDEFARIKFNAKKRGYIFDIDIKYIEYLYKFQKMRCKLSGVPISFNSRRNKSVHNSSKLMCGNASLDRIDSRKGYIKGNIQLVDKTVNFAKHVLSQKQFVQLCKAVAANNQ